MGKGISQIATSALYVGISISAITVAVTAGLPLLENIQDSSSIERVQDSFEDLNSDIESVITEGEGSARTSSIEFSRGEVYFDEAMGTLVYELETDADIISPQTSISEGNTNISSNANVSVNATGDRIIMENERVRFEINETGENNPIDGNTSEIVLNYTFKAEEGDQDFNSDIYVELNNDSATGKGSIHTSTQEEGEKLGTGRTTATVESDAEITYDIVYSLPTGADFVHVQVVNFR